MKVVVCRTAVIDFNAADFDDAVAKLMFQAGGFRIENDLSHSVLLWVCVRFTRLLSRKCVQQRSVGSHGVGGLFVESSGNSSMPRLARVSARSLPG